MFEGKDVHNNKLPVDDPTKHQNRTRSFAHVRGNWATCMFADLKPYLIDDLRTLQAKLHRVFTDDKDDQKIAVKIQPDLHMSVSRTVTLQLHWIELFLRKVDADIRLKVSKFCLFWRPELRVFVNDDRTRTF